MFSISDYCSLVYNYLTHELNTKLQYLTNYGIIRICYLRWNVHISTYKRMLRWLNVRFRRHYFLWIAIFDIFHDSSPPYLRNRFNHSAPSIRRLRHLTSDVFAIPNFCTLTFGNSFYLAAIYFWHSLPNCVRCSPTIRILILYLLVSSSFCYLLFCRLFRF